MGRGTRWEGEMIEAEVLRAESLPRREKHWAEPLLILLVFGPGVAVGLGMLGLVLFTFVRALL